MSIIGSCNYCLIEVDNNEKYINCPDCNRLYHQDCWKKNSCKCTEYGCKGTKEIIEGVVEENRSTGNTNALDENKNIPDVRLNIPNKSNQTKIIILLSVSVVFLIILLAYNSLNKNIQQANNIIPSPSQSTKANETLINLESSTIPISDPKAYSTHKKVKNQRSIYERESTPSTEPIKDSTSEPITKEQESTPTIEPTTISTPEPTPSPDIEVENKQIKELIIRARNIKNRGFLKRDDSSFDSVFTDKALKDYSGGIKWCISNNAYRDTVTKNISIRSISREKGIYTVTADVNEKSDYYENEKYNKKHSYDKEYRVKYYVVKVNNDEFKISKADLVN
ncbi:MAG: DUF4101 domain-containing protein [Candidatus Sericytochromatia bacterium]|nr:DUF4101 domain-containing protein [Candidatus Sericytochromatia bacterium]